MLGLLSNFHDIYVSETMANILHNSALTRWSKVINSYKHLLYLCGYFLCKMKTNKQAILTTCNREKVSVLYAHSK